jgi:two-component system response regulator FixJ
MLHIIDDDKFVRRGFDLLFRSAGMESKSYESAIEFMETGSLGIEDIIILDMHMPEMNGCEFLEYLLKNEIHLPVIIITAYDEPSSRECAKKYSAMAYLRKPVDGQALIDLIKYQFSTVG